MFVSPSAHHVIACAQGGITKVYHKYKAGQIAKWGTKVHGSWTDNWLEIPARYLPIEVQDVPIVQALATMFDSANVGVCHMFISQPVVSTLVGIERKLGH